MNRFTTYLERETNHTMMKVRKPVRIVDGLLVGSEIDRYEPGHWRVWTPKKKLANRIAKENGLQVQLWDTEAELMVPDALAVGILPQFGAKVKRNLSPEVREARKLGMQRLNALRLNPNHVKKGLTGRRDGISVVQGIDP
jgi:hypothetical protein